MWSKSVFLQLLEVLEFVAQQQLTDIAYSRFVSLYYVYHKDMKKQLRARKPCAVPVCSQNWMNDQLHLRKFVFSFFCIDLHSEGLNEKHSWRLPFSPTPSPPGNPFRMTWYNLYLKLEFERRILKIWICSKICVWNQNQCAYGKVVVWPCIWMFLWCPLAPGAFNTTHLGLNYFFFFFSFWRQNKTLKTLAMIP